MGDSATAGWAHPIGALSLSDSSSTVRTAGVDPDFVTIRTFAVVVTLAPSSVGTFWRSGTA